MYYTYILQLENNTYYTGYSANLKRRIQEHKTESVQTTRTTKPKKIIFYAAFITEERARAFEKYLKSSSGFAFRNKYLI